MKLFSLLFIGLALAQPSHANEKISPRVLADLKQNGMADVLIYLNTAADLSKADFIANNVDKKRFVYDQLRNTARESQSRLLEFLKENQIPHRSYHIVNMIHVPDARWQAIRALSKFSEVESVRENVHFRVREPFSQPFPLSPITLENALPQNITSIGVDRVWKELGVKGDGIVIGGQDGGFMWSHPALKRQYRGYFVSSVNHNYSWHDSIHRRMTNESSGCVPDSPEPCDDSGHGTHTMGSMVGDDGGANQIGVAPEAKWIGCRNMERGAGTAATYLECFEFFLAPYPIGGNPKTDGRPDLAPHIINNSWACPSSEGCKGDEFVGAVRAMSAAGILVVAAAGNEGSGCGSVGDAPGTYFQDLIPVAAFDHRDGSIAGFSSRGPSKWDGSVGISIAGPGVTIRSSVPSGGFSDSLYDFKSGTSMASPHVVGVAALLWSKRPELIGKIAETRAILERSADAKTSSQTCGKFPGSAVPNSVFGHGTVNAYKALTQ